MFHKMQAFSNTVGVNKKFPCSARTMGARSKTTGSERALNGNRTDVERNGPFCFFSPVLFRFLPPLCGELSSDVVYN